MPRLDHDNKPLGLKLTPFEEKYRHDTLNERINSKRIRFVNDTVKNDSAGDLSDIKRAGRKLEAMYQTFLKKGE